MDPLLALLARNALLLAPEGRPFRLASGATSQHYLDCKGVTLDPQGLILASSSMADLIEALGWEPQGVGGLTLGADPLAVGLSLEGHRRGHGWLPFVVRKEAKGRGTFKRVEGNLPRGCPVVVLEDTTTTGGSAMEAIVALKEEGHKVEGLLALVDRGEGGEERFNQEGIPFRSLFTLRQVLEASRAQP